MQFDSNWHGRLDELVGGKCSEDEFMDDMSALREARPDSAWDVVALLSQRYRRGQMPTDLFRSIESKMARSELNGAEDGVFVDLITQRMGPEPQFAAGAVADEPVAAPMKSAMGVGRVLRGRYVIESSLGSGGMGTVYKAVDRYRHEHPEVDCHVAIKILHEETHNRPEILAKLRHEFYCAQALSHRSVIKVFELDRDKEVAFFTMEYLHGELLSRVIKLRQPLPVRRAFAWSVIREVGAGLVHAHSRKVIHADLKPQNIMVMNSGEVRILDFGASSDAVGGPCGAGDSGSSALTPAYACCELLEGQHADPRDDLYALACVAYELLAGTHPFQRRRSTEARQLGMKPRRPQGLTRRQWKALALGLSWERQERCLSIRDWLAEMNPEGPRQWNKSSQQEIDGATPSAGHTASTRPIALLAVLVVCLAAWAVFSRPPLEREVRHSEVVPGAVANAPVSTGNASLTEGSGPVVARAAAVVGHAQSAAAAPVKAARASAVAPTPVRAAPALGAARKIPAVGAPHATATRARVEQIGFAAASYKIRAGKNFAEIRVRRTSGSSDPASFVWWTEPGSALAGADYVPQARTTTFFSPGKLTGSLFIKLMPNRSRQQPRVFYVVVGNPSERSSIGLSTTAISLLP